MKNGGLFGISVETTGGRLIENVHQLNYDKNTVRWIPNAIDHAKRVVLGMSDDALTELRMRGVENIYEWVLYKNAVDSYMEDNRESSSGYAHLIMKHHRTMYGILRWRYDSSVNFWDMKSSLPRMALGIMTVMLPTLRISPEITV